MNIRSSIAAIALCFLPITASAGSVGADHTVYVYCVGNNDAYDASYFSEVFVGDVGDSEKYQKSFASFLSGQYGEDTNVGCVFHEDKQTTVDEKNRYLRTTKTHGVRAVETNWSYK